MGPFASTGHGPPPKPEFFNGTHADYHRPSDSVDKIDAEKESRIVKLVFYLGLDVANAANRPKWNPDSYAHIVTGN